MPRVHVTIKMAGLYCTSMQCTAYCTVLRFTECLVLGRAVQGESYLTAESRCETHGVLTRIGTTFTEF